VEYTQYVDPKYAEEIMAESFVEEDVSPGSSARVRPQRLRARTRPAVTERTLRRNSEQETGAGMALVRTPAPESFRWASDPDSGPPILRIMAEITAQLVKQLRERTGAGMMEC